MKKWLWFSLILLLAVTVLVLRTLIASGTFKSINGKSLSQATVIKGITGAEDITIDRQTGIALISSDDRRATLAGNSVNGAIFSLNPADESPVAVNLTPKLDFDFHPHGISLFFDTADSSKWLFVVNHRDAGHFVEIFKFQDTALVFQESITLSEMLSPNDVLAVGKRQFYFTNDHDSHGGVSRIKDFLIIGTGQVVFFDGETAQVLDRGIRYANGINMSHDGKFLYVAACTGRQILIYQREPFLQIGEIDCGTAVDNIELDEKGELWVAAHPKMLAFLSHASDPTKRSPSQILKIVPALNDSSKIEVIYLNDGNPLSGSSVAAIHGDRVLMGTVFEDGILSAVIR